MSFGDLIYGLITLVLMFLFIISPILRKIFRSAKQSGEESPAVREEKTCGSVDSRRVIGRMRDIPIPVRTYKQPEPGEILPVQVPVGEKGSQDMLNGLSPLKKAVVWKEILDAPLALRDL